MSRAKIAALIGCIWYSLLVLIGTIAVIVVWAFSAHELGQMLSLQEISVAELRLALTVAYGAILILMILNWVAFARLSKKKGWAIYLLVVGLFYLFASLVNGAGLVLTLPIALCFILSFILKRKEKAS